MDYQNIKMLMKINKDKNVGRVLFIVEGGKTEFTLLRRIFCNVFGYEYIEKRRDKADFFKSRNISTSRIAVINTEESNEDTLEKAAQEMMKYLENEHIEFDIDKIGITNMEVFERQELNYLESKKYRLMSLLSIAFLDLGIIEN